MTSASTGKRDASPGPQAASSRFPSRERPLVLGHRGFPSRATENTLRSFDLAIAAGAEGVELDVRPTRSGHVVILHDDDLQRTMGLAGRVSELDEQAVRRLTNARVPMLAEAAAWAAAAGAWVNFELKTSGVEGAVGEEIHRVGLEARSIVSSFDPAVVRRFGELHPDLIRFQLTRLWDREAREAVARFAVDGICLGLEGATPAALEEIHGLGYPVVVWTVNSAADVRRLAGAGVAGIISDDPEMASRIVLETCS